MDHLDSFYFSKEKRARVEVALTGTNSHDFAQEALSLLRELESKHKVFATTLSVVCYQDLEDTRNKKQTVESVEKKNKK